MASSGRGSKGQHRSAVPAAGGADYFTPAQEPATGTALAEEAPTLFQPLQIRDVRLHNRFVVSPMCQFSAEDGHLTDWHFGHLAQFILRGSALTFVEATSTTPNGRISPEDCGLWKDSQIEPLRRLAAFAHGQGQKLGIQLAHAGRKASTLAPWLAGNYRPGFKATASPEQGGWPDDVWGPSPVRFQDGYPLPRAMSPDEIRALVRSFGDAAARAVRAGVDVIEIHAAHGYLLSSFLSPLSNRRTDGYGGSFENRCRLLLDTVAAVRAVMPASMPLFLRISATEWMEWAGRPSWTVEDSVRLAKLLPAAGVDLLDVSSGGNSSEQRIVLRPYYQVDNAARIRDELRKAGLSLLIGAVGHITNAEMARSIVQNAPSGSGGKGPNETATTIEVEQESGEKTQADLVFVGRQLLREPEFPLRVASELGVEVKWPVQYGYVLRKRGASTSRL